MRLLGREPCSYEQAASFRLELLLNCLADSQCIRDESPVRNSTVKASDWQLPVESSQDAMYKVQSMEKALRERESAHMRSGRTLCERERKANTYRQRKSRSPFAKARANHVSYEVKKKKNYRNKKSQGNKLTTSETTVRLGAGQLSSSCCKGVQ